MPLLSSLRGSSSRARSSKSGTRPGTQVGSPPLITSPSSQRLRSANMVRTLERDNGGRLSLCQASSALWQVGQRRLQPAQNNTMAVCPGQSQKLRASNPRTWDQAVANSGSSGWGKGCKARNGRTAPALPLCVPRTGKRTGLRPAAAFIIRRSLFVSRGATNLRACEARHPGDYSFPRKCQEKI